MHPLPHRSDAPVQLNFQNNSRPTTAEGTTRGSRAYVKVHSKFSQRPNARTMPDRSLDYQSFAIECRRLAAGAGDAATRLRLLTMAWIELADQVSAPARGAVWRRPVARGRETLAQTRRERRLAELDQLYRRFRRLPAAPSSSAALRSCCPRPPQFPHLARLPNDGSAINVRVNSTRQSKLGGGTRR